MSQYQSGGRAGIRIIPIVIGLIMVGIVMVRGCERGPGGRNQVVAMNPDEEARLGASAFEQILNESDVLPRGAPEAQVVERIGRQLAEAAQREDVIRAIWGDDPVLAKSKMDEVRRFRWEFRVVRSNQANAFCLPGGKVVVYTGIMPVCKTEAGLAAVMGHEIMHALARHGSERMAQQQMVQIGVRAAASSMGDLSIEQQRNVMAMLGAGSQYGILLPFSRRHESEADRYGQLLMAAAGYDPREAAQLWVRMKENSKGTKSPEFASTHPSHERRSDDLQVWAKEAMTLYQKSPKQDGGRPLRVAAPASGSRKSRQ